MRKLLEAIIGFFRGKKPKRKEEPVPEPTVQAAPAPPPVEITVNEVSDRRDYIEVTYRKQQ